ncbi:fN3 [Caudoviricetes sp.]|nr:fN3 [Caudoviricetes sp.]
MKHLLIILLFAVCAHAQTLIPLPKYKTLAAPVVNVNQKNLAFQWTRSPDYTNLAFVGYRLYYGTNQSLFDKTLTLGKVTNAVVTGLVVGATYRFKVVGYDIANIESKPSNTVTQYIDPLISMQAYTYLFQYAAKPSTTNYWEVSTNGVNWIAVKTNVVGTNTSVQLIRTNNLKQEFVRIKL